MSEYVLDASALLTILNQEPGKERVEAILGQATVCTVNIAETIGKLLDAGMTGADARASVELLHLEVIDFDLEMARIAGSLKQSTKKLGLSLGDRCCLALGIVRGSIVVTADRLWSRLKVGIQVEVLR
jgi:PIN domain nuclease of toxin-antitoxin system